ncbi:hypothetical protein HS7_00010 [Sulfolobales archaeon HS-7]|nr:hypothetical protein HS7_00010 [Sulfolobales archaeon HS-7]
MRISIVNRRDIVEIVVIIVIAFAFTVLVLRNTLLTPGIVYVRDSYPDFIRCPSPFGNSQTNVVTLMDNPLFVYNLMIPFFPPEVVDKLYYFLPLFIGFISMYFSSRYFLTKYFSRKFSLRIGVISGITASLFTISPTFMYYTYWVNYATFVALVPVLLAGLDLSLSLHNWKTPFGIALFASLSTTDPRGFLFTIILTVIYVLFYSLRSSLRELIYFVEAIPIYLLVNIRTFLSLFLNSRVLTSYSTSISNSQLWLNYLTYSFEDNLRGIGLFRPFVNFFPGNFVVSYTLSFIFPFFLIVGTIFAYRKIRSTPVLLFLGIYLGLVIILSSSVTVFGKNVTLDLIYYVNDFLVRTPFYNYMWLILPTYLPEIMIAPFFLVFSMLAYVMTERSNMALYLLLMLVITSQLVFSYSSYATGNYAGNYVPTCIPEPLIKMAEIANGSKILIYSPGEIEFDGRNYSGLIEGGFPNSLVNPVNFSYIVKNPTPIMEYLGAKYMALIDEPEMFKEIRGDPGLKLVYNQSGFALFQDCEFSPAFRSTGATILANYPQSLEFINSSTQAYIPGYIAVPFQLVSGVLDGNITCLLAVVYSNYSVKIPLHRIPFPYNFTADIDGSFCTFHVLSNFPGISVIEVVGIAKERVKLLPGTYDVLIQYVSFPSGGIIEISNGTLTYNVSTNSSLGIRVTEIENYTSPGYICLIYPDNTKVFLVRVEAVSVSAVSKIELRPEDVCVTTNPVSNNGIPSVGYTIVTGKVTEPRSYTDYLIEVNGVTVLIVVLLFEFLSKRRVKYPNED